MSTLDSLLDYAPTEEITRRAREVDVGRVLLALLAAVFMFVGKTVGITVTAFVWCFVAMSVGYRQVRPKRPAPPGR